MGLTPPPASYASRPGVPPEGPGSGGRVSGGCAVPIAQERKRVAKLQQDAAKVLSKVAPLVHAMQDAKGSARWADVPKEARSAVEKHLATLEKYQSTADERIRGTSTEPLYFTADEVTALSKASTEALKTTLDILKSFEKLG